MSVISSRSSRVRGGEALSPFPWADGTGDMIPLFEGGFKMANTSQQVPGRRWLIGCLLGVGILINYIDRVGLSAATPELTKELGLTATDIGLLSSAFFWTYSLLQVPGGMVLDRFGVTAV